MPVLGAGGVLTLRRELPPALVVTPEAVRSHVDGIEVPEEGYWTGDKVYVWGPRGLPFDLNGDGRADLIGGFGMFFGSRLTLVGARAARLISGSSRWFGVEPPFQTPEDTTRVDRAELFVFRDSLDRITFFRTFEAALDGDPAGRLQIFAVDFGRMLVAPVGATGYQDRLAPTYPDITTAPMPAGIESRRLTSISTAALPEPEGDASDRAWTFIAEMDEWSLELDARDIDTTGLGEAFGEATRALVTGGGQMNFFVNRFQTTSESDATFLTRLLILLDQGCKAEASFRMTTKASPYTPYPEQRRLPINDVFYKADLVITANAINTRAEDVIRATANFVTVGRIKLSII